MNPYLKTLTLAAVLSLAANAAMAADAKTNWDTNCAKCHGPDGKGQTKMGRQLQVKDYTDAKVQAEMKDEDMLRIMTEGVKDGKKEKMPTYKEKLSAQELKDLLALVRSMKK